MKTTYQHRQTGIHVVVRDVFDISVEAIEGSVYLGFEREGEDRIGGPLDVEAAEHLARKLMSAAAEVRLREAVSSPATVAAAASGAASAQSAAGPQAPVRPAADPKGEWLGA